MNKGIFRQLHFLVHVSVEDEVSLLWYHAQVRMCNELKHLQGISEYIQQLSHPYQYLFWKYFYKLRDCYPGIIFI